MPSFVYIIHSKSSDRFYAGYTKDLDRRIYEHQNDLGRWTKGRGPWRLVYFEEFENDSEARKREIQIKRKIRKSYLVSLIENGPGYSVD